MKKTTLLLMSLLMILAVTGCSEPQVKDPYGLEGKTHSAVTPADRPDVNWWMPRHEKVLERITKGNVDLIMIGDSITHGWENSGKEVWDKYYAPRNAVNMGFSGDRTQHVLWRLENGEIDGINPKLAVLMIGTNNSNGNDNTSAEIADGIKAICAKLREKLPETKILILAIFPRGDEKQRKDKNMDASFNLQWAKNNAASLLSSNIVDNKYIFYLDINSSFLNDEHILTRKVMPDLLHPRKYGYEIWAEAMEPTIKKLMD